VIHALCEARFGSVIVVNRTLSRAESLAHHFGKPVRAESLERLPEVLPEADIVVNATSAGMEGRDELPIDWSRARSDAIATDLVYAPLMTPFLRAASERDLRIVDGLGMLLHQAVPGFERWFGVRPEVDGELRSRIVADLDG
jgi:shikimate dehydrogenase